MPKGLVADTGPAADELAPPGGVVPVPEEAQEARNPPIGIMAAAASEPRRKSRRCIGFSVMLMVWCLPGVEN